MRYQFFLNPEENRLFREALNYGFVTFNQAQIVNIQSRKPEGFGITQKIINAYVESIEDGVIIQDLIYRHYNNFNNSYNFCLSEIESQLYREALFAGLFDRLKEKIHKALAEKDMEIYNILIKQEKINHSMFGRFT